MKEAAAGLGGRVGKEKGSIWTGAGLDYGEWSFRATPTWLT